MINRAKRRGISSVPRVPGRGAMLFAVVSTGVLFLAIALGFVDTATNSALGCGRSFPLCHGFLFPTHNLQAVIEWSHRTLSAVAGVSVGMLCVWAWVRLWSVLEVRWLALGALGFILVESVAGALAVVSPESKALLAAHLGIALTAFASAAIMTHVFWALRANGGSLPRLALPRGVARWVWAFLALLYVAVYAGAYVAGTRSGRACLTWPLCAGPLTPSLADPVTVDVLHRLIALVVAGVGLFVYGLVRRCRPARPDLLRLSQLALVLIGLQIASGFLVVVTGIAIGSAVLHVITAIVLFTLVADMAFWAGCVRQ